MKHHYSQTSDFIFGLSEEDSFEDFLEFYRDHVVVGTDPNTGFLLLRVEAYTPKFSKIIVDKLLQESEQFINESSQLIAEFEMKFALNEIELSQNRLKKSKQALIDFQNQDFSFSLKIDYQSISRR